MLKDREKSDFQTVAMATVLTRTVPFFNHFPLSRLGIDCQNLATIGAKLKTLDREMTNRQTHGTDQHTWRNLFRQVTRKHWPKGQDLAKFGLTFNSQGHGSSVL